MSFSHEDLRRWKIQFEKHHDEQGMALIARLEAAESVIGEYIDYNGKAFIGLDDWHEAFMCWRKACGK